MNGVLGRLCYAKNSEIYGPKLSIMFVCFFEENVDNVREDGIDVTLSEQSRPLDSALIFFSHSFQNVDRLLQKMSNLVL